MRFLIDANLPRPVIDVVQSLGIRWSSRAILGWRRRRTNKSPNMRCNMVPRFSLGTWTSGIFGNIRLISTQVLSFDVYPTPLWP
jgi:hypothetical protein